MRASPEACGNYWTGVAGTAAPTWWQVDVIGPLPSSEGCRYAITRVHTATGLLAAYPARHPDQKAVTAALEWLCAAYGRPWIIENHQGTHFAGPLVQQRARDLQIHWKFHAAYHSRAARVIEWYEGLLKQGLRAVAATPMLAGWTKRLWTVL